MMCQQIQESIQPYLDRELDLLTNLEIQSHIGECEACRFEQQNLLKLRSSIRTGAHYFTAPASLRKRIEKHVASCT